MSHARAAVLACLAAAALPAVAWAGPQALEAPTPSHAWTARVLATVTARAEPSPGGRAITVLQPIAPLDGGPTVLLVTGSRRVGGREWVHLRLPVRPNGVQGWVPAGAVRFNQTRLRITIDQSDRRLVLYRAGRPVLSVPVAGAAASPLPRVTTRRTEKRIWLDFDNRVINPAILNDDWPYRISEDAEDTPPHMTSTGGRACAKSRGFCCRVSVSTLFDGPLISVVEG